MSSLALFVTASFYFILTRKGLRDCLLEGQEDGKVGDKSC